MMMFYRLAALASLLPLSATAAATQPDLQRTVIVDKNGNPDANYTTIGGAINGTTPQSGEHWTILIYGGEYQENVTLGLGKRGIDLVGVDRDAVIVAPTSGNGIVIGSSGASDNHITNITVKPAAGHGILLAEGSSLTNVVVEASGTDKDAVQIDNKSDVRITGCTLSGKVRGLYLDDDCEDITVSNCTISGESAAVRVVCGDNILFQSCVLRGRGSSPRGLWVEDDTGCDPGDITALLCDIGVTSDSTTAVCRAVESDDSPETGKRVRLAGCRIQAAATAEEPTSLEVIGVYGADDRAVHVLGGVIITSVADTNDAQKATAVYDLYNAAGDGFLGVAMSGTRCSKWKGPISSAERRRPVLQRVLSVLPADSDKVYGPTSLGMSEIVVTSGITNPSTYRVLTATGSATTTSSQKVHIIGTDWAGNIITDRIALNGSNTVLGSKAFATVTKLILPVGALEQSVAIGTSDYLGLYMPLASEDDVLQQGRMASNEDVYTQESRALIDDIDETYSTIKPDDLVEGDSFEWASLASE
ncbi:MAG: right-handed parallel beta-helix repeat-containing protein [Phycisphaerae bacterium]|nr:right-handed parallel beta-helix repeat-containing protein [Phycisphaerae bacterium]